MIGIREITVGAENIKCDFGERVAGWSALGGFITTAYSSFVSWYL